jgi:bifunctional UDP-N-acetylglucosamine pyrophosphorylase/glucosamine-1-phosphate N-acetyltransferase
MSVNFQAVILAAGKGTRMKSERPKVLHEVLGRPMIGWVVQSAIDAGAERVVCVLGYGRDEVEGWLRDNIDEDKIEIAIQEKQLGTAHAVWAAREWLEGDDTPKYTAILSGDVPNMDAETMTRFFERTQNQRVPLGLVTAVLDDAAKYGRILRDADEEVTGIIEFADATPAQRDIDEINAGVYFAKTKFLEEYLPIICEGPANTAQGEYYLTDMVAMAAEQDGAFGWKVPELRAIQGVNTRAHLAEATAFAQERINRRWMEDVGVTMIDPKQTYVEPSVELAQDITLYPGVHLKGDTQIGSGAIVENGTVVTDSHLAANCHIKANCYITEAKVGSETAVGPMAQLRPGADIGVGCKVGNFVEVKKSRLEDGAKAGHLTYLGDAHVGAKSNIGAGTITCNYDGENKHKTIIGERCFIGSNTALVAPVELEDDAYVGAGSTITDDVPSRALAVARGRQRNIEDWNSDGE